MLVTALSDALMLILSQSYHSFLLHSEVKFLLPSEPQDQKFLLGTSGFHRGLLSSSPSPNSPVSYPSSSIPSTSVELTSSTNTNTNTVSIGGYDIPLYMFTPIVISIGLAFLFVVFYYPILSLIKRTLPLEVDPRDPPQPALAMQV